jgi:hypothetical protein
MPHGCLLVGIDHAAGLIRFVELGNEGDEHRSTRS